MSKAAAMRAARKAMLSGYQHHSRTGAQEMMTAMLRGRGGADLTRLLSLETYADVLAPTRFRAMQNGLICLVTVISRVAVDHGVENELAFALSDYYVNEVELQATRSQLEALMAEVIEHYIELVREEQQRHYSLPVTRAIRYIDLHLYGPCRIADVAAHVGLNPQYFAVLFKKEAGRPPSQYVAEKKLDEAGYLMRQAGMSVTEVSEALGYSSPSHFIKAYKKHRDATPKKARG